MIPNFDQPLTRVEGKTGFVTQPWFRFFSDLLIPTIIDLTTQVVGILPVANGGTGGSGVSTNWVPSDVSGAGLAFTLGTAKYRNVGGVAILQADFFYPVTASAANAAIGGVPIAAIAPHSSGLFNGGLGGGVSAVIIGTTINIFTSGATPITNANLSGARVILTMVYQA